MAEVIHERVAQDASGGNAIGFMMGILLLVILAVIAFYFFGAGRIMGGFNTPQVNVPRQVDVNVNK